MTPGFPIPPRHRGFTLIELMVSLAVMAMLMVLLLSLVEKVTSIWRGTAGAISQWQGARRGFEAMTRQISQATLNTTWAYFDSAGNLTSSDPVSYGRYSDLHFVSGPASTLLSGIPDTVSQSVFFQAPLGRATDPSLRGLPNLLNVCGFFVQFNGSGAFAPNAPIFSKVQQKFRFRLMQVNEPAEGMSVFSSKDATNFDWITKPIGNGAARPLAENIVALFLLPKFSRIDTSGQALLAPDFYYNSRQSFAFSDGTLKGNTLHQLPPLIQVTMVAIDESSAARLEMESGMSMPQIIPTGRFAQAADFEKDLKALEEELTQRRLRFRTFTTVVAIRGAKWSGDTP